MYWAGLRQMASSGEVGRAGWCEQEETPRPTFPMPFPGPRASRLASRRQPGILGAESKDSEMQARGARVLDGGQGGVPPWLSTHGFLTSVCVFTF